MLRQINSAGCYCHQAKLGSNLHSSLGIARRPGDDSDDTRRVGLRDGCQVMRRKSGGASTKARWLGHRGHLSEVRRIGLGRPVVPVAGDVEGERQRADKMEAAVSTLRNDLNLLSSRASALWGSEQK